MPAETRGFREFSEKMTTYQRDTPLCFEYLEISSKDPFDPTKHRPEISQLADEFDQILLTTDEIVPPVKFGSIHTLHRTVQELLTSQCWLRYLSSGELTVHHTLVGYAKMLTPEPGYVVSLDIATVDLPKTQPTDPDHSTTIACLTAWGALTLWVFQVNLSRRLVQEPVYFDQSPLDHPISGSDRDRVVLRLPLVPGCEVTHPQEGLGCCLEFGPTHALVQFGGSPLEVPLADLQRRMPTLAGMALLNDNECLVVSAGAGALLVYDLGRQPVLRYQTNRLVQSDYFYVRCGGSNLAVLVEASKVSLFDLTRGQLSEVYPLDEGISVVDVQVLPAKLLVKGEPLSLYIFDRLGGGGRRNLPADIQDFHITKSNLLLFAGEQTSVCTITPSHELGPLSPIEYPPHHHTYFEANRSVCVVKDGNTVSFYELTPDNQMNLRTTYYISVYTNSIIMETMSGSGRGFMSSSDGFLEFWDVDQDFVLGQTNRIEGFQSMVAASAPAVGHPDDQGFYCIFSCQFPQEGLGLWSVKTGSLVQISRFSSKSAALADAWYQPDHILVYSSGFDSISLLNVRTGESSIDLESSIIPPLEGETLQVEFVRDVCVILQRGATHMAFVFLRYTSEKLVVLQKFPMFLIDRLDAPQMDCRGCGFDFPLLDWILVYTNRVVCLFRLNREPLELSHLQHWRNELDGEIVHACISRNRRLISYILKDAEGELSVGEISPLESQLLKARERDDIGWTADNPKVYLSPCSTMVYLTSESGLFRIDRKFLSFDVYNLNLPSHAHTPVPRLAVSFPYYVNSNGHSVNIRYWLVHMVDCFDMLIPLRGVTAIVFVTPVLVALGLANGQVFMVDCKTLATVQVFKMPLMAGETLVALDRVVYQDQRYLFGVTSQRMLRLLQLWDGSFQEDCQVPLTGILRPDTEFATGIVQSPTPWFMISCEKSHKVWVCPWKGSRFISLDVPKLVDREALIEEEFPHLIPQDTLYTGLCTRHVESEGISLYAIQRVLSRHTSEFGWVIKLVDVNPQTQQVSRLKVSSLYDNPEMDTHWQLPQVVTDLFLECHLPVETHASFLGYYRFRDSIFSPSLIMDEGQLDFIIDGTSVIICQMVPSGNLRFYSCGLYTQEPLNAGNFRSWYQGLLHSLRAGSENWEAYSELLEFEFVPFKLNLIHGLIKDRANLPIISSLLDSNDNRYSIWGYNVWGNTILDNALELYFQRARVNFRTRLYEHPPEAQASLDLLLSFFFSFLTGPFPTSASWATLRHLLNFELEWKVILAIATYIDSQVRSSSIAFDPDVLSQPVESPKRIQPEDSYTGGCLGGHTCYRYTLFLYNFSSNFRHLRFYSELVGISPSLVLESPALLGISEYDWRPFGPLSKWYIPKMLEYLVIIIIGYSYILLERDGDLGFVLLFLVPTSLIIPELVFHFKFSREYWTPLKINEWLSYVLLGFIFLWETRYVPTQTRVSKFVSAVLGSLTMFSWSVNFIYYLLGFPGFGILVLTLYTAFLQNFKFVFFAFRVVLLFAVYHLILDGADNENTYFGFINEQYHASLVGTYELQDYIEHEWIKWLILLFTFLGTIMLFTVITAGIDFISQKIGQLQYYWTFLVRQQLLAEYLEETYPARFYWPPSPLRFILSLIFRPVFWLGAREPKPYISFFRTPMMQFQTSYRGPFQIVDKSEETRLDLEHLR